MVTAPIAPFCACFGPLPALPLSGREGRWPARCGGTALLAGLVDGVVELVEPHPSPVDVVVGDQPVLEIHGLDHVRLVALRGFARILTDQQPPVATLLALWMPTHVEVRTSAHAAMTIALAQAELADPHLVGHAGSPERW